MSDENNFTSDDRKALTGLIVEVRLRFDSLDQRLTHFEARLIKVEENSVNRMDCGRQQHDTSLRFDRMELLKIDGETVRAIEQRVGRIEQERATFATLADVTRAEAAVAAARTAVEKANADVESIKNRQAYFVGLTVGAIFVIQVLMKFLWH